MSHQDGPQFTAISQQLATRMPTEGVSEEGVATAIRSTLYAAKDAGILKPVTNIIEEEAKGDQVVLGLVDQIRKSV